MAENTFRHEDPPGGHDPREEHRYSNLEDRVNKLTLICWSMWTLIMETTDLTEEDLLQRMKDLDIMDGHADQMVTPQVARCPKCNRTMSAKHNRCLYCGTEKFIGSAFDYLL